MVAGSVQYDGLDVHYSAQQYLSAELHTGHLPFWTPYVFSGFPFLADLQVGAWYPLNWPFFALGITPRSIDLELLLNDAVASLGAFALARRFGLPPAAAALSGMFYGLSGWFATHSQHVGMFDTAAWLPWLLFVLLRLESGISASRLALAGLVGAAIMLPGSFQLALYTFFFVGVWALSHSSRRRILTGLVGAGVLGGLIAAVMILPGLELVSQSVRTRLDALALPDIGYFHFGSMLTLVDPNYYGLLSGNYTGPGDSTQHYFYAGILLTPLALLGARNGPVVRTAALLGLPFLVYALGPRWGLYQLLARLPGFSNVELPMHGWFLPALGLALLGGAGAARIPRHWAPVAAGAVLVDVLLVNQLLNPLAYARADDFDAALGAFAEQVSASPVPVQRVYGPPLAAVGYRNHGLQSRVATTYGYNPLELAVYADYAAAAEEDPSRRAGFAATHVLADGATLAVETNAAPFAYFPSGHGAASVLDRSEDSLRVRYASSTQDVLRVAVPFYPGWTATLAGDELPIQRVDEAFIGVVVPPGEGDIRLAYVPRVFGGGAAVSALALLGTAAVLLRPRVGAARLRSRARRVAGRASHPGPGSGR